MAYQKLQAGRAWSVNTSDNTDIPDIGTAGPTGTTTSGSATQLIDTNATFLTSGVHLNMIIVNTTDNTQAVVIGIEGYLVLVSRSHRIHAGQAHQVTAANVPFQTKFCG